MSELVETDLRFEVLGALRVWRGDTEIDPGPRQQRVVLAALLLCRRHRLSREQIIDAVWGPEAPSRSVNLLQRHISGLRRALEPGRPGHSPSQLLTWTDAGYTLHLADDRLDLARHDRELERARVAERDGDLPSAAQALRSALALWRGAVCEGLNSPFLDAERDRLAERRTAVAEDAAEAELALGHHAELVTELRRLVADNPLRERLSGLLMLSLYRSGRQAEALAAYREAQTRLDDELGVQPSAPLQRLHQQILAADEAVAAPAPQPVAPADAPPPAMHPEPVADSPVRISPRPAQLPGRIGRIVGREPELDWLGTQLPTGDDDPTGIAVVTGSAGVGKTTLAVHWAHQVKDRFPDGQLYVNLRGFDPTGPPMEPIEAVHGFLDAFGIPPQQLPVNFDAQAALYRSLLADRQVLIVLDNAAGAEQVRPLLPGGSGCLVVVTSRNRLGGLVAAEGARPMTVGLLGTADAGRLLADRLGEARVAAEPGASADIVRLCDGLPLALTIVAARAAMQTEFPLADFAEELRERRGRLDAFGGDDEATDVRTVFSWSYDRLSPPAGRLFRLLGLHPGAVLSAYAAASLAGSPPAQVRPALAELARAHLITERRPGLFGCHDLLRAYATELVQELETAEGRRAAHRRVLDHYLHSAYAADRLLNPHRDPIVPKPPDPAVTVFPLADREAALAWFTAAHATLLAALDLSAGSGCEQHAAELAWSLITYFERRGHRHDLLASQCICLDLAIRCDDRQAQAEAERRVARALTWLGRHAEADAHYQAALAGFEELGDPLGQAHVRRNIAWDLYRQDRHAEALAHAQKALALFGSIGHRTGQADALNAVGWFQAQLGDYPEALECCKQALTMQQEIGYREGEVATWDSLGYVHHRLGHSREAMACYERALELWRQLGDRFYEADTLTRLGDTQQDAGSSEDALASWSAALAILNETDHPDADAVRMRIRRASPGLTPYSLVHADGRD